MDKKDLICLYCEKAYQASSHKSNFCTSKCATYNNRKNKNLAKLKNNTLLNELNSLEKCKEYIQQNYVDKNKKLMGKLIYGLSDAIINVTNFLNSDAILMQRVWHIMNNNFQSEIKCSYIECNNSVKFSKNQNKYNLCCSPKCSGNHRLYTNPNPNKRINRNREKIPNEMTREEIKGYIFRQYITPNKNHRYKTKLKMHIDKCINFIDTHNILQKAWHIITDINEVPLCKVCNENKVKWDKHNYCYPTYCDKKCQNKDPDITKTRNQTYFNNFGGHPMKLPEMIIKREETSLKLYNKKHYTQTEQFIINKHENNMKNWGVKEVGESPIVQELAKKQLE